MASNNFGERSLKISINMAGKLATLGILAAPRARNVLRTPFSPEECEEI
jgi:hypothetical protein